MYWFNDADKPQVHAASGLTRDYLPKPSFWAVSHLQKTLGSYRFEKIIRKTKGVYVYAYIHNANPNKRIVAVWYPDAGENNGTVTIDIDTAEVVAAERMPYTQAKPTQPDYQDNNNGTVEVEYSESPVYLWIEK